MGLLIIYILCMTVDFRNVKYFKAKTENTQVSFPNVYVKWAELFLAKAYTMRVIIVLILAVFLKITQLSV